MIHILGDQGDLLAPLEFSFRIGDVQVDLFAMQEFDEHYYFQVFSPSERKSFMAMFPKITKLCAGDLHNRLVYVPCNTGEVLEVTSKISECIKKEKVISRLNTEKNGVERYTL